MTTVVERNIQIELYRILQNLIAKKFIYNGIEFTGVKFEAPVNGRPDLVVEAIDKGKKLSLLVIETKRKVPFVDRKFDPYSKDVIKQASGYAVDLGAPYFATCNGDVLVLFDTFTAGVPLPQRKLKHYKVSFDEEFAKTLLKEVCNFRIGVGKWLELDDVFLQRLRTFHDFMTPFILKSLNQHLRENLHFKKEYVAWLRDQFFEFSQKTNEQIAEQVAYLIMNKITFYKTLEIQIGSLPKLKKIDTEDPQDFYQKLTHLFEYVRKEIDYEAIFGPNEVLDKIPLPKMLVFTLNDFIEELGTYNLSKIRSEVIGRVYEELIPENERHRLGQYYTPPPIIELITEMCIKSPNDRILDPACGSGGFLIKAYHKLSDLKKKENPFENDDKLHEEILNQLYGVEINPFPAQLSSINLAVRDLRVTSKNINLIVSDFFKVDQFAGVTPEKFSVVVTNPPYTDWREMENRCSIRETALNYKDDVTIDIGKQAGVYAYFFTQAAKFLQDGGRMGMIVSDAWLDMDYGIGLKEFFLNFFKIKAIIGSATGVFDEPLVNTVIVILEKCENDPKAREENTVVFCKLKKSIEIKKAINSVTDAKESFDQDSLRVEIIRQGNLESESLWGLYLRAPRLYFELARNPMITELKSVSAKTRIGLQTFADKFYIVSKDTAKTWGIEQKYLRKIITSPKLISKVTLGSKEVNEFVILCSDKKENLRDENILRYIEWGESTEVKVRKKDRTVTGFQKLPRVQKTNREPWYNVKQDINSKGVAAILYPYMAWNKITFVWNPEGVLDHQNFIGIIPKTQDSTIPLLAVLNSSLSEFIVRCTSHIYGGGVAKLKPGDIKKIKVVNIEKISKEESELLTRLFQDIIDEKENSKQALDDAIFKILKLNEKKKAKIFETIKELRNAQIVRKEVDVLVQTADRWKSHKKPKKEKIVRLEPSKKLDKWME